MTDLTDLKSHDCWRIIGVEGDRSCPELSNYIHCHNCPIYSAAGRHLFDREIPEEYVSQWTNLFAQNIVYDAKTGHKIVNLKEKNSRSVVIFRLEREWFALAAQVFKEVTQVSPLHTIPHRSNEVLLGVVNIRGEILLCVSLHNLLGLKSAETINHNLALSKNIAYQRMVVLELEQNKWVFLVDEIDTLQRFQEDEFKEPPSVIFQATHTYTQAIIHWQNKKINYLDFELLFYALNQKIL